MRSLTRSTLKTLSLYFVLQCLAFFAFFRIWRFSPVFLPLFFSVQVVFYLLVLLFLVKNNRLFYNTQTGEQEIIVNAANKITLFRITMLPFLVSLTLVSQTFSQETGALISIGPALTVAFAITFASDFLDGRVAKAKKLETHIGKILDSGSDYLLLGVCAIAFFYIKQLTLWLFITIIVRLLLNAVIMLILLIKHKKLVPQTTPMGKLAIAVIMILLVIEAAKTLGLPSWVAYLEIAAAVIIGVSMIDKVLFLLKNFTANHHEQG
jgi:phosphatidylglycerophosphate synthase